MVEILKFSAIIRAMKNQIISWLVIIIFIALGVFVYIYGSKPVMPQVEAGGKIAGNYSIASIMKVAKPYKCVFERNDGTSKISGVIHINGDNAYGELRISTETAEKDFTSFLLIKGKEAYVWTSLQSLGYRSTVAESALRNASAQEQAQIVGTRDKLDLQCETWQAVDNTIFDIPVWIRFVELK